ncbi:MAG: hypothetical protein P8R04_03105, partial [Gammaproteobacteria bacterium]|nr:hypothetical protein [Gammaproteobacteria bacterium]
AALAALESGIAIAAVAQTEAVDVQSQQAVARGSRDIPSELLQSVFATPRPSSTPAPQQVLLPDGSVIVAQVDAVMPGKPEELPRNERDARKVQLEQMLGQSQVAALVQNLRDSASIRVFDDVLQESQAL